MRPAPGARRGRRVRAVAGYAVAATLAVLLPLRSAYADLIVPAGGSYTTNSGQTDLACTDVVVAGTLTVDSGGLVNVRHLTIQPGGTIDGGSGVIQLGGDWTNNGTFNAGTGTVQFADLCGLTSATISGNTTFFNVSFVSSIGKNYVFAVGSTQTVSGLLTIAGTVGNPIQFRSGTPGQTAFINLLVGGTQAIQHVGVTDVWATGQWLAPLLTNEGGGGNASRWFGVPTPTGPARPVPTLADLAMLALAALLAGLGIVQLRQRRKVSGARRPHHD